MGLHSDMFVMFVFSVSQVRRLLGGEKLSSKHENKNRRVLTVQDPSYHLIRRMGATCNLTFYFVFYLK